MHSRQSQPSIKRLWVMRVRKHIACAHHKTSAGPHYKDWSSIPDAAFFVEAVVLGSVEEEVGDTQAEAAEHEVGKGLSKRSLPPCFSQAVFCSVLWQRLVRAEVLLARLR